MRVHALLGEDKVMRVKKTYIALVRFLNALLGDLEQALASRFFFAFVQVQLQAPY